MSVQEVITSEEDDPLYQDTQRLVYQTEVIGKGVLLEYLFGDNQLFRTRYYLRANHIIDKEYVQDYRDFQKIISSKYGSPKQDLMKWHRGRESKSDGRIGTAVSIGHLQLISVWESPHAHIKAVLKGKHFKIDCIVEYTSRALSQLATAFDRADIEMTSDQTGQSYPPYSGGDKKRRKDLRDF